MQAVRVTTILRGPQARCFDLARSIDAHLHSAASIGERVVAGRASGLIGLGEEVPWEARHLGVRQRLSSRITAFDRPRHFQDRMVRGAFAHFEHDHHFAARADGTTEMTDVLRFAAPWGILGRIAERLVLASHLRRFLEERNRALRSLAESDGWRAFVPDA